MPLIREFLEVELQELVRVLRHATAGCHNRHRRSTHRAFFPPALTDNIASFTN
jgi:hypothetical protein